MAIDLVQDTDYAGEAKDRLGSQFQDKTNISGLVEAIALPFQGVEDTSWDFLNDRSVATAVGAQLDIIGEIVGISRNGMLDDEYRFTIYGQIAVNNSKGTIEDLVSIFNILTGSVKSYTKEIFPGMIGIFADRDISMLNVQKIYDTCKLTLAGGVGLFGIGSYDPGDDDDSSFTYFGGNDSGAGGYGTTTDASIGGRYATLSVAISD